MFVTILYLLCFWTVSESVETRTVNKRNDIDLQTCIDNFNVHKDKIIRTQDSRDMGAKYLNEIDLGSREECLRLCCETDTCDVFVFEEKNPGSCYLFHCGPPEDFKCKFTRHANYSSAVLGVNRHLNELENQIKLTKHEQDLARLRKPDETQNARPLATKIPPLQDVTTTTQRSREILPIGPTKSTAGKHCSPYQFECRSSGECIAIYNACDGIPQCSDGSDEAPELDCPAQGTTLAPSPQPAPMPVLPNNPYPQNNQLRKPIPHLVADNAYQNIGVQSPRLNSHESADFMRPQETRAQMQVYQDPSTLQQPQQPFAAPRPIPNNNNWIPHQNPIAGIAQNPQYTDKNSRIFNHKESGLQVDSADRYKYKGAMQTLHRAMAMGQYVDSAGNGGGPSLQYGYDVNTRNDYQKPYYGDGYRQYQQAENWQQNPQAHGENSPYAVNDNWQPQFPQNTNDQNVQPYHQNPEINPNWKADLLDKKAESKTFDHTIIHEPKEFDDHKKEHIKEKTEEKEHPHKHVAEELKQTIEDLNLKDGEAERPGGAILSLTLGVCLTCVMAILIGCRLRVVRRRMRRGGKSPYAHDADYLVNGMYL